MGHARRKLCELLHTGEFFLASRSTGLWAAIPRDRAAATAERDRRACAPHAAARPAATEAVIARPDPVRQAKGGSKAVRSAARCSIIGPSSTRGCARGRAAQDGRDRPGPRRSRRYRPLHDLEHRSRRGARARQSDRTGGGGCFIPASIAPRAAARGLARITPSATTRTGSSILWPDATMPTECGSATARCVSTRSPTRPSSRAKRVY